MIKSQRGKNTSAFLSGIAAIAVLLTALFTAPSHISAKEKQKPDISQIDRFNETLYVLVANPDNGTDTAAPEKDFRCYYDFASDGTAHLNTWVPKGTFLLIAPRKGNLEKDNGVISAPEPDADWLSIYDQNNDAHIDADDAAFEKFKLWRVMNGDCNIQPDELIDLPNINQINADSLSGSNGLSIKLVWKPVIASKANTKYANDVYLSYSAFTLPHLRGYGQIPNLTVAASMDKDLRIKLANLKGTPWSDILLQSEKYDPIIEDILLNWDQENYDKNIDNREKHLRFIEKITNLPREKSPRSEDFIDLVLWPQILQIHKTMLLFQIGGKEIFSNTAQYTDYSGTISQPYLSEEKLRYFLEQHKNLDFTQRQILWGNLYNFIYHAENGGMGEHNKKILDAQKNAFLEP